MLNRTMGGILVFVLMLLASNANAYNLEGSKWGNPTFGTGATISWSLIDTTVACDNTYITCEESTVTPLSSFMPTGYVDEIRRAFATWAAVADLTFIEMTDSGGAFGDNSDSNSFVANIRFGGMYIDGDSGYNTLGYAYYPISPLFSSVAGDMILDRGNTFSIGSGTDIFSLILHELGHSLGILHNDLDASAVMYPDYHLLSGLSQDDIDAVQKLYGPNAMVPLPATVWLLLSGLGLFSMSSGRQRSKKAI